ncbi:MAG: hypothetical protein ACRDHM_08415 [Actinomycetota bacterium]
MITKDPGHNLGVRDVARMAGVSHPRTAKVLAELDRAGLVNKHETRWGPVFELNDEHFLAPQLWVLFDDELHVLRAIEGFVRGEARKTRRPVRARITTGIGTELAVVMTSVRSFGAEDERWFRELEEAIERRFGLEVRVGPPDPGEWLLTLD